MSQDAQVSFEAVDDSESGDGGVEHGALLSRLCEAIFEEDGDQLASVKDDVIEVAGANVLIDAVAVSANFYMMTRIADSTGTASSISRYIVYFITKIIYFDCQY